MSDPTPAPAPAPAPAPSPAPAPAPSPSPSPSPAPSPGGADAWYTSADYGFDDKTRAFYAGKNHPDVKSALLALPQADEFARSRNVIPKPDAKNLKDWAGWSDLGYEPDAAKYATGVTKPEVKNDGDFSQAAFDVVTKSAHANKVPAWQASAIVADIQNFVSQNAESARAAQATQTKDLDTKLRGEWGSNYDANTALAKKAFRHFEVDGTTGAQMDEILGSPLMVHLFHKIGEQMGEDRLLSPGNGTGLQGASPDQARAERLKLETDKDWMAVFNDPRHPQNKDYINRRNQLMEIEARKKA